MLGQMYLREGNLDQARVQFERVASTSRASAASTVVGMISKRRAGATMPSRCTSGRSSSTRGPGLPPTTSLGSTSSRAAWTRRSSWRLSRY